MGTRYTVKPLAWRDGDRGRASNCESLGRTFFVYTLSGGGVQLEVKTDGFDETEVTTHETVAAAKAFAERLRLEDLLGEIEAVDDEVDLKAGGAIGALEAWCRKGYTARIDFGPSYQPGDEGYVELKAAGRKVQVGFIDCDVWDEEKEETIHTGDATDAILEALRLWHADPTPKLFKVIIWHGADLVRPESTADIRVRPWTDHATEFTMTVQNEAAAIAAAERLIPDGRGHVHAWEQWVPPPPKVTTNE